MKMRKHDTNDKSRKVHEVNTSRNKERKKKNAHIKLWRNSQKINEGVRRMVLMRDGEQNGGERGRRAKCRRIREWKKIVELGKNTR